MSIAPVSSSTSPYYSAYDTSATDPNPLDSNNLDPNDPANQDPTDTSNQAKAAPNTAPEIADLRKVQQQLAKQLKEAEKGAGSSPAGQALIVNLTTQITAIESTIDNIQGLGGMVAQKKLAASSKAEANSTRALQQQITQQSLRGNDASKSTQITAAAVTDASKSNAVRLDMKGTVLNTVA
ncbi:hypothetical protein [Burkholderia gladioli]|uniref:hypothetical protein n=1 Tax=Burkholderia gladioli TaxID=28095 RepID=UPI0016420010|nr:hypothetical protein [Burkholderia gladioli]